MAEPVVHAHVKSAATVLKRRQDYDLEPCETFMQLFHRVYDVPLDANAIVTATIFPDSRELALLWRSD